MSSILNPKPLSFLSSIFQGAPRLRFPHGSSGKYLAVRLLPQPHDVAQSLNGASAAVPKLTFDVNVQVSGMHVIHYRRKTDICVQSFPGHSFFARSITPQQSHAQRQVFQCWKQVAC
jgi:hypothetical protein